MVGGAGFIGSNLAHRLKKEDVTIVDCLPTGSKHNVPEHAEFLEGDACTRLDDLPDDFDTIYHFGGARSAPLFDERPRYATEAVDLFQHVLDKARACDASVAFASTSSMYNGCPKPYREDMAVQPTTLYEFSKLSMEHLARAYAARYGVNVTAFRFF